MAGSIEQLRAQPLLNIFDPHACGRRRHVGILSPLRHTLFLRDIHKQPDVDQIELHG